MACHHCGEHHSENSHLFCFSRLDVDLEFVRAAAVGDLGVVEALLANDTLEVVERRQGVVRGSWLQQRGTQQLTHVNVRARPRFHRLPTALHRACAHGQLQVVSCLLQARASVASRSARFATPLHVCATVDCAALLLQHGALVGDLDYSQSNAVVAARTGTYCKDPSEQRRLVLLLATWKAQHEASATPRQVPADRKVKTWPGMSMSELARVVGRQHSRSSLSRGSEEATDKTMHIAELSESECSICLTMFADSQQEAMRLRCGHWFHIACVSPALRRCCLCPYCRQDARIQDKERNSMSSRNLLSSGFLTRDCQ